MRRKSIDEQLIEAERADRLKRTIIPFRRHLYEARAFKANTQFGSFEASGTLCGHIDFVGPFEGTYALSADEALAIIGMLQGALEDVLKNSDPVHDPRLIK